MKAIAIAAALFMIANAQGQSSSPTLQDLQKKYVGHKAYLTISSMGCWHQVVDVVAIEPFSDPKLASTLNALGETVPAYNPNPRVNLTIKCIDGTTATRDILKETVIPALMPVPDSAEEEKFSAALETMVGRVLYLVDEWKIFSITASLEDMRNGVRTIYSSVRPDTPLTVESAKIAKWERGDFGILKVKSPANDEYLVKVPIYDDDGKPIVNSITAVLRPSPPACWVKGLEKREIGVGLSESQVECRQGMPDKVNDYGAGGEQWIYESAGDGKTFVYIKGGVVVDIQRMSQ